MNARIFAVCSALTGALIAPFDPLSSHAAGHSALQWSDSFTDARSRALNSGRLLLVIHLPGCFARNSASSREAQIYRQFALSDAEMIRVIRQRYIPTYINVGPPDVLKFGSPRSAGKSRRQTDQNVTPRTGQVVTYFVTPQGRVLHLLVGYPTSRQLLEHAKWADELYRSLASPPREPADQALLARQAHLRRVLPETLRLFQGQFMSRWHAEKLLRESDEVHIRSSVKAALSIREGRILGRFAPAWPRDLHDSIVRSVSVHAELEDRFGHLLLAELPLVEYAALQEPVFEELTSQTFWHTSPRRIAIARGFTDRLGQGAPYVLLVCNDPKFQFDEVRQAEQSQVKLSAHFLRLTRSELATLMVDADLDPIESSEDSPACYVVLTDQGKAIACVNTDEGISKIQKLIRIARGRDAMARGSETLSALVNGK